MGNITGTAGIIMVNMEINLRHKWYALSVYARQEKAAHTEILGLGIESFLPTFSVRRLWSDRIKQLEQPLFSGYLFVKLELTPETRIKLIRLRQVIDFVGKNRGYALDSAPMVTSVPETQIESLRVLLTSSYLIEPTVRLLPGTEVMVSQGPLKGAWGIVEREATGKRRMIVQVPLLGRGVRTELCADDVLSCEELGFTTGDRQGALL